MDHRSQFPPKELIVGLITAAVFRNLNLKVNCFGGKKKKKSYKLKMYLIWLLNGDKDLPVQLKLSIMGLK